MPSRGWIRLGDVVWLFFRASLARGLTTLHACMMLFVLFDLGHEHRTRVSDAVIFIFFEGNAVIFIRNLANGAKLNRKRLRTVHM
jgi:hypothetical protein